MLRQLPFSGGMKGAEIPIRDASWPSPHDAGLEYSAPARGPWNIVHTGMLVPESHQIYTCARGCLRGVVLTAAEMNAMSRMSWVSLEENDLCSGVTEKTVTEGCIHILEQLERKPRAVLIFPSCIHLFSGFDFDFVLSELRKRFPEIDFIDSYMHPTMRKSGLTPDQLLRKQMYAPLRPCPENAASVSLIGNDRATDPDSYLCRAVRENGSRLRDIVLCRDYEEYLELAESFLMIATYPPAKAGAEALAQRLGRKFLYLPQSFSYGEIRSGQSLLAAALGLPEPDPAEQIDRAENALSETLRTVGEIPVEIDYTATSRPLGLARLLLDHGFRVSRVYADVFSEEERGDFEYLVKNAPELLLTATVHPKMRFAGMGRRGDGQVLAIGQKAAYFSGTAHFVNIVAGGGAHGFEGIVRMSEWMTAAFREEKNTCQVIRRKGLGCESCLS